MDEDNLSARFLEFKKKHPEAGRERVAIALGICTNAARRLINRHSGKPRPLKINPTAETPRKGVTQEFTDNTGALSSLSAKIKTLDDLLAHTKVDLNVWEVERYIVNKWEVAMKIADVPQHEGLWQVKAWLRRRVAYVEAKKWVADLIAEFKTVSPHTKPIVYANHEDGHLLEISIADLHLGKLAWSAETGSNNYDIKITESLFREGLECLLKRASSFPISKIAFIAGNDFYHTDGSRNETTAGTPQDADGRWQKSFVVGKRLMIEAILRMRKVAPVDIVLVSGNHDQEKLFCLGEVLESYFHATNGVTINNAPTLRKYYAWGNSLILFTHGNNEKHSQLPLIMATEHPKLWAASKHREVHLGHFHHKKNVHYDNVGEEQGVRVRILPSLSANDAWHASKGYNACRSAEAYLYHKTDGVVGYFAFNP